MKYRPEHLNRGFSLIELMVAVLIGVLLMLGIVQVFSASRSAYQLSEGVARTQENSRFAIEYLQRDLRMVGHFGCVNDQTHLRVDSALRTHFTGTAPHFALDFPFSIQAYEATDTAPGDQLQLGGATTSGWSPALPAAISALGTSPLAGSDVLVLRFLASEGVPVQRIAVSDNTTNFTLSVTRSQALKDGGVADPRLFGIADCSYTDIFSATAAVGTDGVVNTDVAIDRYTAQPTGQSMLYRAESLIYYVATGGGGSEPSLYRVRFNGTTYGAPEELVEGVESMQLLFGQDSQNDVIQNASNSYVDRYNTAETLGEDANQWRRVGAVQIGLLMRSPDSAAAGIPASSNQAHALGVKFVPPQINDGRHRAGYEITVALRNRLHGS